MHTTMGKKTIQRLILALAISIPLSACNKFLDIQTKGTLTEDVQFRDLRGYEDAMYGVYGTMAKKNLYGGELAYGFLDNIGQTIGNSNTERVASHIGLYEYQNRQVEAVIGSLWSAQYEAISFVNNIIRNAEEPQFSNDRLGIIRGEAYGLRAFLHFDVVRLFAMDYRKAKAAGTLTSTRGIPYSYTFSLENRRVYNLEETYQNILRDLDQAEALLATDETIKTDQLGVTSFYDAHRAVHFNKYAVYATKARVYNSMGEYDRAAEYARRVIDHTQSFNLVARASFTSVVRFPASGELIFGLYSPLFVADAADVFLAEGGQGNVDQGRLPRVLSELYSSGGSGASIDNRQAAYYRRVEDYSQFIRFISDRSLLARLPNSQQGLTLIRLPEMYYILAEAIYGTNPQEAIEALNKVRDSRGLAPLTLADLPSREAFDEEILKEYLREMPGEGQSFFALKRANRAFQSYTGATIQPSDDIFVLPWPQTELTYGNR